MDHHHQGDPGPDTGCSLLDVSTLNASRQQRRPQGPEAASFLLISLVNTFYYLVKGRALPADPGEN